MTLQDFPALDASLIGTAALLLTAGFFSIKLRKIAAHRACMLGAFSVSAVFLGCYLYYHVKTGARTPFGGTGVIRTIYYTMLISHILLAFVIVIVGGLGSMTGALLGGLLIGVSEAVAGLLLEPSLKSMFSFGLLIVVMLLRPQGLLGRRDSR